MYSRVGGLLKGAWEGGTWNAAMLHFLLWVLGFFCVCVCVGEEEEGPHLMACTLLVPQPGIEPRSWHGKWSPNHWIAREFSEC